MLLNQFKIDRIAGCRIACNPKLEVTALNNIFHIYVPESQFKG